MTTDNEQERDEEAFMTNMNLEKALRLADEITGTNSTQCLLRMKIAQCLMSEVREAEDKIRDSDAREEQAQACRWVYREEYNFFQTDCGQEWRHLQGYNFCPTCGKLIEVVTKEPEKEARHEF